MSVETNLGELLLNATEARPEGVCVETEAAAYTFEQVVFFVAAIRRALRKALGSECSELLAVSPHLRGHERLPDEHVVMIVLERGVESIAAIHAVMLEGCAYNAFDVAEPVEKLRSWVEVARPPVMISTPAILARFSRFSCFSLDFSLEADQLCQFPRYILDVEKLLRRNESKHESNELIAPRCDPKDLDRLAYLIFTSGSTGRPKAVMIRHESALNLVRVWSASRDFFTSDRLAQISSMSWDAHVMEVFGAMAAKATSVTCPDIVKQSGPDMLLWLRQRQITHMFATPSHLRTMFCGGDSRDSGTSDVNLPKLRMMDVGGEAIGADVVSAWAKGRYLFNSYGPTEASVLCTSIGLQPEDPISLGPALPSYKCYILEPQTLVEQELGEVGVLFVGGVGLARGYLDEEQKTSEKFIEVPSLGRLFNTGDLAFKDRENHLHYRGRADFQVKVRGLRIELEAVEQAISKLPTVKHCEARVVDSHLVLLASVAESFEAGAGVAEVKALAASLGRGYVLSQVKLVDDSMWKFGTSGKLLRNVVPWDDFAGADGRDGGLDGPFLDAGLDPLEAFDKVDASALELEIAACVAKQLRKVRHENWNRNSHFVHDLGIDSAGMAGLLGHLRQGLQGSQGCQGLRSVSLRALFGHPTVSALAAFCAFSEVQSDQSEDENAQNVEGQTEQSQTEQSLLAAFLLSMNANPHSVCCELPCSCLSYMQLFHLATAYQRLLGRSIRGCTGPVVICLDLKTERMAAILAVLMEGCAFGVLDEGHDLAKQLHVFNAQFIVASSKDSVWQCLQEVCAASQTNDMKELHCIDVNNASLPLHARMKRRGQQDLDDLCFHCVTFDERNEGSHDSSDGGGAGHGAKLTALSQRAVLELLSAWPELQRVGLKLRGSASGLALLKVLFSGGAVVDEVAAESLICHQTAYLDGLAFVSLPMPLGHKGCSLMTRGEARESLVRKTREMMSLGSLGSLLACGAMIEATGGPGGPGGPGGFGESWPVLCSWVQGIVIVAEPVLVAARMMLDERVVLPVAIRLSLWQSFLLISAIVIFEQLLRIIVLLAAKWLLVGRYKEAQHDIYSLFYLRHWLVQRIADGTIIGDELVTGTCVGFHFLRNLVLKALGADVALTAVITTRVVAFDLVSVGHLATVHGKQLTAVHFGERRMILKSISVGNGAFVGTNSVLEPGCRVAAGAHVEDLSMVPCGFTASARVSGVPCQAVGAPKILPSDAAVQSFRCEMLLLAIAYWLVVVPMTGSIRPFIRVLVLSQAAQESDSKHWENLDALPEEAMDFLPELPLVSFIVNVLLVALQLLMTILICRLLPRVKPPCSYSLTSIHGMMLSLKMLWVTKASKSLEDASMVPAFMRMCGAQFGRGVVMACEVVLPDTLVVGNGCFIASRNILTSATMDQGQYKVPCTTHLGDHCYVGNDNCLQEGLPEGSFCGLNTLVPKRPQHKNLGYFGNPAMTFQRSQFSKDVQSHVYQKATRMAMCWYHFSTSVIDPFILPGLQGMLVTTSFLVSRSLFPVIANVWDVFMVTLIYLVMNIMLWLFCSVILGNILHNGSIPTSSNFYSTIITQWITAIRLQKLLFLSPFRASGTKWHACLLRLEGARIGKGFFCLNEEPLSDAPFTSIGDDVIMDYGAGIRCHSFEDHQLKFSSVTIGDRATIMAGAKVAMCNVGEGTVLRPASVTWKGHHLEAGTVYQGAPAEVSSVEQLRCC